MSIAAVVACCIFLPSQDAQPAHLLNIAGQYARTGQWTLARETYQLAANKYEGQPAGLDALRWLVRYHSSSEYRRRDELKQRITLMDVKFAPTGQLPTKDNPFREGGGVKPLADGTIAEHTTILSNPAQAREWHQAAVECESRLTRYGAKGLHDPEIRFGLAAAKRTLSVPDGQWLQKFLDERPTDDAWRGAARQELWQQERGSSPPRFAIICRKAGSRPHLDGKFDKDLWSDAAPLMLNQADGTIVADEYATKARIAYDDEYLYLAIECKHPPGRQRTAVKRRTRDMDVDAFDRVEVLLDMDRDYQSYYRFRIDQRGGLAEDCTGDAIWNPRWYVAFANNPDGYVIEAAIARADLTGDPLPPGRCWAVNVVRIVPGQGILAAAKQAGAMPRPENMGLMTFSDATRR